MIGKAKEIAFYAVVSIEGNLPLKIHAWMTQNPDVDVYDIKYTSCTFNRNPIDGRLGLEVVARDSALIIYKEATQ